MFQFDKNIVNIPIDENNCRFDAISLEEALKKIIFDVIKNSETSLVDKDIPNCPIFILIIRDKIVDSIKLFKSYEYYMNKCPI